MLLLIAAVTLAHQARQRQESGARSDQQSAVWIGIVWALLATVPVAIVVHIWSSYYYLFATCGVALAIASLLEATPTPVALVLVTLVAWGSESARQMQAFASKPDPWGTESHLSRFYFDRSMRWVARYLEDLRRQRPTLPHRATLYFSGIPAFASWQSGNGALVRWAYRDTTLHSYFFGDFTRASARRGEVLFFTAHNDSLIEAPSRAQGLLMLASGQMLSERFQTALDAIECSLDERADDASAHYWRAWLAFAMGDSTRLASDLRAAACEPSRGPSPELEAAHGLSNRGDASGALGLVAHAVKLHALDPVAHAELADALLMSDPNSSAGGMEALAARLLAPTDPLAWRRWAYAQVLSDHPVEAHASLSTYFALAGPAATRDEEAVRLLEALKDGLPGGRLAQAGLQRRPNAR